MNMKKTGSSVPWKMIFFLIILAFVVFFAGFNLTNVSDISFGFYKLVDVPIFISLFIAFIVGALVMLPFVIKSGKGKADKKKIPQDNKQGAIDDIPEVPVLDESDSPRYTTKKNK